MIPSDMLEALGVLVTLEYFVDLYQAGSKAITRSHSIDDIIFLNNAPIIWFLNTKALWRYQHLDQRLFQRSRKIEGSN